MPVAAPEMSLQQYLGNQEVLTFDSNEDALIAAKIMRRRLSAEVYSIEARFNRVIIRKIK